jgi:hypothetical protein
MSSLRHPLDTQVTGWAPERVWTWGREKSSSSLRRYTDQLLRLSVYFTFQTTSVMYWTRNRRWNLSFWFVWGFPTNIILSFLVKQPFLNYSQIPSGFHFFVFRNSNSFTKQGRQPCVQPPTWRTRSLYLCPQVTGCYSYTPRYRVLFFFVAFYCSQGYVEVF